MKKFVIVAASLVVASCQTSPVFQKSSLLPRENYIVQKYENKLVQLEKSDNYLVKDVVLYRVNNTKNTNLTFVYNSRENHIKAILVNCTTQEAEEIAYYPVNKVSERILAGYLPPNDPQATPVKHEPPISISIPISGYSLVCK